MWLVTLRDLRRRDRNIPSPGGFVGKWESALNGVIDLVEPYHLATEGKFYQTQTTFDELHPGPPYREDGVFLSVRKTFPWYQIGPVVKKQWPRGTNPKSYFKYDGGFDLTSFTYAGSGFSSNNFVVDIPGSIFTEAYSSAASLGPEAWNKSRPEIEKADLGVFVGESREIPGMFRGSAKFFHDQWKSMGGDTKSPFMSPKKVADEFLNQQFGWRPFLGDLSKFHDTFVNTDKYLAQIERDNGQWVHRRRVLFDKRTGQRMYHRSYAPSTQPYLRMSSLLNVRKVDGFNARGTTDYLHQSFDQVWFSAYFKYYLSQFDRSTRWYDTPYGRVRRYAALYGARVSPSVVYNLTPWTWLADWVSNAGDNVDNLTAMTYDNLVARNACIMRRRSEVFTVKMKVFFAEGDYEATFSHAVESKSRSRASPFGFDLTWGDLSPRQLAILGALGISRGNFR